MESIMTLRKFSVLPESPERDSMTIATHLDVATISVLFAKKSTNSRRARMKSKEVRRDRHTVLLMSCMIVVITSLQELSKPIVGDLLIGSSGYVGTLLICLIGN